MAYIAGADSFFIGTASREGWPHVQHRGGPAGFLKVLDDHTLAFADYAGNRQYITVGNLTENDRVLLFVIDYERGRRLKLWGRAEVVEGDAALLSRVHDPDYPATAERVIRIHVLAWDLNCRQHFPRLVHERTVQRIIADYEGKLAALAADAPCSDQTCAGGACPSVPGG
jgi:predicted pyridoxine 5'-phosphate oxidase superfamily flavin-nucleotide-binding protein